MARKQEQAKDTSKHTPGKLLAHLREESHLLDVTLDSSNPPPSELFMEPLTE
ncbi:hypothetical protein [Cohnella nanjingensis]|uniref:hypothetical protein n=1 Tax=Cohnella nanjingensis TaxID=1387779 RepID=UPI001FE24F2C|nr:hypothetical protein [Cohnella nanjingensis]